MICSFKLYDCLSQMFSFRLVKRVMYRQTYRKLVSLMRKVMVEFMYKSYIISIIVYIFFIFVLVIKK